MADYNPPTENLPIFDSSVFLVGDVPLTQNQADKRYLKYPNAQGTENLQAINVNGAAVFNSSVKANTSITYVDNTVQNSAFTGAAALAGSYTSTNLTVDANGKITALANGTGPINQTLNSLLITPNPNPGAVSTTGIFNQFNAGALYSLYNGSNTSYGSNWSPTRPLQIRFITNSGGAVPSGWGGWITLEVNFWFATGSAVGQTTCTLMIFGNAIKTNWGSNGNTIYNINNKINGNDAYYMTDATYAPYGRQYYTYNQTFSGISGANAYLSGTSGSGIYTVYIYFQMPAPSTFSYNCKIIDISALSGYNVGVEIFS